LLGGGLLLAAVTWLGEDASVDGAGTVDSRRIVVEREALLDFARAKTGAVDAEAFRREFDASSEAVRRDWVDRYVREEALVREARALGLDRDDEIVRRRLVQKLEFLSLGVIEAEQVPDEGDWQRFYEERKEDHRVPESVSFGHVFVSGSAQGEDEGEGASGEAEAEARAEALLARLGEGADVRPNALGDRFLYNRHYSERTVGEVRSHFGDAFTTGLLALEPDPDRWQGPFRSDHGWHLVLYTRHAASRIPVRERIEPMLRDQWLREQREAALDRAVASIVSRYTLEVDSEIGAAR
jgi:hypothetical protein